MLASERGHDTREAGLLMDTAPNAAPQLLPEAGAQRTLYAVACMPWLDAAAHDVSWRSILVTQRIVNP